MKGKRGDDLKYWNEGKFTSKFDYDCVVSKANINCIYGSVSFSPNVLYGWENVL